MQKQEHGFLQGDNNIQQPGVMEQPGNETRATIEALTELLKFSETRFQGMHEALIELHKASEAQCQAIQQVLQTIQHTRAYRLLHRLGRWRFMEQGLVEFPLGVSRHTGDSASLAPHLPTAQILAAYKTAIDALHAAQRTSALLQKRANDIPSQQQVDQPADFDACYAQIREPKQREWVAYTPGAEDRIIHQLRLLGWQVRDYEIDVEDYRQYFVAARYVEDFPHYYPTNLAEKSLEHYLAAHLLQLNAQDIYIDIASEHSPVPEIYRHVFATTTYRQDLAYPLGLHGDKIGGNAAQMPLPEEFATKIALHCSFEHFEGDSDIGFIRETARILSPGGVACIVPLYLFEEYAIQTDPVVALPAGVVFDEKVTVYCAQGWNNRYGRFYSPAQFASRVGGNLSGLQVEMYRFTNVQQVDAACYVRFALLLKKPKIR